MNKEKREIKNYIILFIILLVTVIAVFYVRGWYLETKKYYANNSVILDVASEIHEDEISNYTLENPQFILYVASGQNSEIKELENGIKQMIVKKGLENSIIYLNMDTANKETLQNELKKITTNEDVVKKITSDSDISMYVIEEGKITKAIINVENLSSTQIGKLLDNYGVTEND